MTRSYHFILLRRGLGFWLGVRVLFLMVSNIPGMPPPPAGGLDLMPAASLVVVLVTTGLVLFNARVAGEDVLIANFGIARWQSALPVLLLAIVLETLTRVVLAIT